MGGMRWAKGEVRRKDCVRVIMARRVSVPCAAAVVVSKGIPSGRYLELRKQRNLCDEARAMDSGALQTYQTNPHVDPFICQEPMQRRPLVREHVRIPSRLLRLAL